MPCSPPFFKYQISKKKNNPAHDNQSPSTRADHYEQNDQQWSEDPEHDDKEKQPQSLFQWRWKGLAARGALARFRAYNAITLWTFHKSHSVLPPFSAKGPVKG
jgi:hypothetical protein